MARTMSRVFTCWSHMNRPWAKIGRNVAMATDIIESPMTSVWPGQVRCCRQGPPLVVEVVACGRLAGLTRMPSLTTAVGTVSWSARCSSALSPPSAVRLRPAGP